MRFFPAVFVVCLAIATQAAPKHELGNDFLARVIQHSLTPKKDISDIIGKAVEKFRSIIKTGDPKLGLPPMDPYVMDHREVELGLDILQGSASVDDMSLTGLASFNTNTLSGSDDPLTASFDVTIPTAVVDAKHYKLNVMLGGKYNIFGEGTMHVDSTNLGIKGDAIGEMDAATHLQVTSLNLTVSVEAITSNIQGLMNNPDEGAAANDLISEFGPSIVDMYGNKLGNYFGAIIMNIINTKIKDLTLDELLHLIES
ncbi:uncharacterized protein LOC124161304 [Ischnura elegans]|uniref:uncharacterized protein LOC124161304 n=1 Tax=Ischnura elegans TaxID=197161 RepID=UPI001ED89194|nr:uncharacterized protein LOC124161304 [Ischnura elegans]